MSQQTALIDIEVRYAETDQMGVVHHANYVVWLELARTALCSKTGFHYADIEKTGFLLMVTGVELRYLRPAFYGDVVQVHAKVGHLASRGVRFEYEVRRGDELLSKGATDHIWVDKATRRPCRAPEELRRAFEALGEGGEKG